MSAAHALRDHALSLIDSADMDPGDAVRLRGLLREPLVVPALPPSRAFVAILRALLDLGALDTRAAEGAVAVLDRDAADRAIHTPQAGDL